MEEQKGDNKDQESLGGTKWKEIRQIQSEIRTAKLLLTERSN